MVIIISFQSNKKKCNANSITSHPLTESETRKKLTRQNKLLSAYGTLLSTRQKSKGNNDVAPENNRQLNSKPAMKNVARN